jgi:ArsR family transcriptional regulator
MDQSLRDQVILLHAQICKGLADPNRILILYALNEHPYNVGDLAEAVGLPQPTISRHLKTLRDRNLVSARRDAQSIVYELADARIIQALDLLRTVLADTLAGQANLARSAQQELIP